jgi:hypothetical protein
MSVTFYVEDDHLEQSLPTLNVSNRNARWILASLGLLGNEELCGTLDATDLLKRCMSAEPYRPAVPTMQVAPNMWDSGLPKDYFFDRYKDLMQVAFAARRENKRVVYA